MIKSVFLTNQFRVTPNLAMRINILFSLSIGLLETAFPDTSGVKLNLQKGWGILFPDILVHNFHC